LNLGAQLFWQAATFPDAMARAKTFVTYPQFWSWWLTGVAANEPTSLGAHTDLWDPRAGHFSSLVEKAGWTATMAPLRSAFDMLGPVRPDLAAAIGLRRPVPVACGIHDSNASLLPHLQSGVAPLSIVSTGTWAILFAVGGSLDALDSARDTLANVDAYGRATPSARFMGGREFDMLTDKAAVEPDAASIAAVIGGCVMALPTFAPGNGPFPKGVGRWSHDPASLSPQERAAAASLYVALMTATCLDLLHARGASVIEGPFARNALFRAALAALTARPVLASPGSTGTSAGAARLARPAGRPHPLPDPVRDDVDLGPGFPAYAARWKEQAGA
jgi:sugar (pentulose or hexulose) kinase